MDYNNETEEEYVFRQGVSLRIHEPPEIFEELSKILTPTHSHKKGEFCKTMKSKWDNDIWILDSPLSQECLMDEHLEWLINIIKPHQEYFDEIIRKGVKLDVYISYSSDCETGGFSINSSLLEYFCKNKITLEFSVIFF